MNLRFQRRTDLALSVRRTLGAAAGGRLPGSALASQVGTSLAYLSQVVASLVQRGWVTSERGPGGGYCLTEAAAGVSLLEVIEATEGPANDALCSLRDAPCPGDHPCPVHAVWSQARQVLVVGFSDLPVLTTQGAES